MKVLIADDDAVSRLSLRSVLERIDFQVEEVCDLNEVNDCLERDGGPQIAVLNCLMAGGDVFAACRKIRESRARRYVYLLLLTAPNATEDIVAGLEAGADDCITTPYDFDELRSRLKVGQRWLRLEHELNNQSLETSLDCSSGSTSSDKSLYLTSKSHKTKTGLPSHFCVLTKVGHTTHPVTEHCL
jgi:DNA-binding response OmpR family regulator